MKITEISVTGNKTLSSAYIISVANVKVGDIADQQKLDDIRARLENTHYFGYRSASPDDAVNVQAEENRATGQCKVMIKVEENDTLQRVSITGAGPLKPEEIQKLGHYPRSFPTVYNVGDFDILAREIQTLYRSLGYAVVLTDKSGPDDKTPGVLNIDVQVARVSEIKISGNHRTKRVVITRELKTKVGDYYNENTLNRDRQRLYNLDLFEDVIIEEHTVEAGKIGLVISLTEKRTGTVSVGVGYSNRQQLVGRAEVADTNFRGMGESASLLLESGGVANQNSAEFNYTRPWLDARGTALSFSLFDRINYRFANSLLNSSTTSANAGTDTRYYEKHTGASVTVSRPFKNIYRGAFTIRGEDVRVHNLDLDATNAAILQNGPIYAVGGTLIRNTRDLDLDPISGGFDTLSLSVGHANLKSVSLSDGTILPGRGSVSFGKTSLDLRQYISLTGQRPKNKPDMRKTSIALRLMAGVASGQLPFFEQFFIGGAETLRGYREDRFWGKNMVLASAELRHPLANALTGVLFVDAGSAWGGDYDNVNIEGFAQKSGFNPHFGVGAGIRVRTPLGPLRLDFGVGSEGSRTYFSLGNVF